MCAVYDALVGACAREHGLTLATRDQRALRTYHALEVAVELLDSRRCAPRPTSPPTQGGAGRNLPSVSTVVVKLGSSIVATDDG